MYPNKGDAMKPTRLSSFAGLAALVALAGCAPNPQVVPPDAFYGQPGSQGVVPQSAAGTYGQYAGNGTYGTPSGYAAPQGTYGEIPTANGAYGSYGATGSYGTYGNGATAGYATAPSGYPGAAYGQNAYGQPVAAAPANGYYPRGSGQYPPPSTFDVRQPYYGDGGYHLMGTYNDGESHPLRLVSFAVAPVGYLAEWLVTRPIHRIVAQQDMAPIFSYVPQAGFDYETYEEGLSTGVTFEEPQSVD